MENYNLFSKYSTFFSIKIDNINNFHISKLLAQKKIENIFYLYDRFYLQIIYKKNFYTFDINQPFMTKLNLIKYQKQFFNKMELPLREELLLNTKVNNIINLQKYCTTPEGRILMKKQDIFFSPVETVDLSLFFNFHSLLFIIIITLFGYLVYNKYIHRIR